VSRIGSLDARRAGLLSLAALAGAAAVVGPLAGWQLARSHAAAPAGNDAKSSALAPRPVRIGPPVSRQGLIQTSGVEIVRVALSGGGGLIDVRYRVVDADKAATIHSTVNPPLLLDQPSGAIVDQLLMGHLHGGRPKVGVTYFLLFTNPGDIVRRGSRVSVQLGGARVQGVPVQ
jgi:hypothetical protein